MATGGGPFEEGINDQDLPNWSNEGVDDRLNNMDWGGQQKKANKSSEKNKKKFGVESDKRVTNDISPESSPGVGRRRTKTPHSFPHSRYVTQMSVPEQAELEKLKQRINFSDLDQRSIGSDSQGRATAANNKRQLSENRKPFNFLPMQINTNKSKDAAISPPKREMIGSTQCKELFASALSNDLLQNCQVSEEDGRGEPAMESSQIVSRLVQIRDYITKASSMREDLVEKNERSANVERLTHLIDHLKEQEKSYMKFLQKILARENEEEDVRTIDSAVGSGSVAESTSLNIDVQSEASDTTEESFSLRIRPCIEDKLGNSASQEQVSDIDVTTSPKGKGDRPPQSDRELRPDRKYNRKRGFPSKARDPQQEPMEEIENLKKQHDLLKRMLQQQEQLRALQGRQAALLALQHKAEQAIAVMDDSEKVAGTTPGHHTVPGSQPARSPFHQRVPLRVVTETTGSVSGVSITSELNEELNDLIQRFHNQLRDSQPPTVPDNRRQAESLSLTREVSQSRNPSVSEHLPDEKVQLFSKMRVLQEKKQKMDKLLGELHTLRDQHLNNSSFVPSSASPQRSVDQRSTTSAPSAPIGLAPVVNGESNSFTSSVPYPVASLVSQNESENEGHLNPTEKLQKLNEVRKRLNELRELVHYYEQTSDMMTDAVNENTKDEETEESEYDSEHENPEPVTNIRNPQVAATWNEVNSNSNAQCVSNNREGRSVNSNCEINNRSAANIRTLNMPPSLADCHYNREGEQGIHGAQGEDDEEEEEAEDEGVSGASLTSHRSSLVDEAAEDAEFEQKINRLMAAKQKLRQLQDLVAMVQDDDAADHGVISANTSNLDDFYPAEEDNKQSANNTRGNANKTQKDAGINEKAREKFYEAKLQQQQRELRQLQEERKKLIEIQEKIQALQKACPDLQLSATSAGNCPTKKYIPAVTSTPVVNGNETSTSKSAFEPADPSGVDNELWSEMRRHEMLREELRQRRKQLEALMAEHQRRQGLAETTSPLAVSLRSDGSENLCTPQQSRTEKTMATWGGSTQCALDEEGDEDGYLSEGVVRTDEEEEEEEQDASSNDNFSMYPPNSANHNSYNIKETKNRWKNSRPFTADGNYRPLAKTRQQNISMQRQENLRWMSELSYVEEKEQWQEQINQLKKQLDFSVNICQTLMQDQQTLSCLLQTLLTGPYSVMPSNVASPQVHLIMHQLNQCYTQLTWQQNNVQRLKQMLNELMRQQNQHPEKPGSQERGSSAPQPSSPSLFCPFSFPSQPVNLFNLPGFTNFSSFAPGMNFSPLFPSNFGEFSQNISTPTEQQQPLAQNSSGKTEYMAFPKPFESSSSIGAEKQRNQKQPGEEVENSRTAWLYDQEGEVEKPFIKTGFPVSVEKTTNSNRKNQLDTGRRRRQFDEESLESFSSMPDPVDPTTVTKTFKTRKASAQASLASKDKTPKSKSKKRHSAQLKSRVKNTGYESASVSSTCEPCKSRNRHSAQTEEPVQAKVFSRKNLEQLEKIIKYSRSTEISSAHARRILQQSNRNACNEAPETGSDFSMFEALRDTIYSEVATLISQNESHPHFLIELFHELQLLNTDYLRQRALYALQDIVTRHISENHEKEGENVKSVNSGTWIASNSELTPSESLATTDDETFEKNFERETHKISEQNDADNASVMSVSSNFEPFATDDLGNTVIHLDQALARMREYERMKTEAESSTNIRCTCRILEDEDGAAATSMVTNLEETPIENHGSQQPVSEVSTVPCPRIDTQQLDRQIKAIMKEVIPFLKILRWIESLIYILVIGRKKTRLSEFPQILEHMDEVCSSQLLTSVRRMVLTLTQQNDESKEFVKFFHKQLGSILQDSLAKFAGRKLKDCGEDLLVEISEVLFNELAFFKLMQDLDNNSITVKQKCKRKIEAAGVIQSYAKEAKRILEGDHGSPAGEIDDEDKDKDETETVKPTQTSEIYDGDGPKNVRSDVSDQEEDEESEECPVSINLSKAETQALTNYGSGEDENEDEEIEEFEEGPVDVQTSLQANTEATEETEHDDQVLQHDFEKSGESKNVPSEQDPTTSKGKKYDQDSTPVKPCYLNILENEQPLNSAVQKDSLTTIDSSKQPNPLPLPLPEIETLVPTVKEVKSAQETPESSLAGSPDTESPVLVNDYEAESGNISQKSDEEDFVKVEDLPLKLTIYSEADLRKKMVEEQEKNHLSGEILCEMQTEELAGNSQTLKEPETVGAQSV
ncbi:pericentriolar material 1 protein isoform X1 [Canis lupus familiaris]|uniref:pericentriolar material 1 protein isoform X1 n=1 Tax=Canis lupus dingo TaxID=286419 RepID=UPI0015F193C4|nr:pericentriolar material 1 protein isoform X1 [Canis lupus dingo]XP_035555701.1 pericentriolar material 1 protein isoform X1 [Canis lupus dingo]XP_035555702.1 pericentriolar material 1 protein isoform X1 [Canis lupus dingo]XP_035555703.1 pericentriolar material 1 protein isoform X1 [Canis lupus dingo]XP_035555705.1 pericentriolar material 1 protein isoform X1 [Canis lupus dingo]XP_038308667.1 pericentriolar material 1 protein isoform X1 [Canis lupus familiaris]XP_038308668.1 pericentriolar 